MTSQSPLERLAGSGGVLAKEAPVRRSLPVLAALRYHGFRPLKRYIVFQVLPDTLGLGPEVWRMLSKCHEMRNRTEYEGALDADDRLVLDLLAACHKVAEKVRSLSPISGK